MTEAPIVVEVHRGSRVESRHRVALCVCDPAGRVVLAFGEVARSTYPRSAIKPFQAIPLVESGAADALGLDDAEIALACASHSGTPEHVARVGGWLERIGRGEADLACGAHDPLHRASAHALWRSGAAACRLHNNCSGKHAGMLTLAAHRDRDPRGYVDPAHPVQREILAAVAALTGAAAEDDPAVDGCSAPAPAMPLAGLATGAARLADPSALAPPRRAAIERIARAMRARPDLVAGPDRLDTDLMRAVPEIVTKTGAEGVFLAAALGRGLGVAVKAEDGAGRAAEATLVAALDALGLTRGADEATLAPWRCPVLRSHAGEAVGRVAVAEASRERLESFAAGLR